MRSALWMALLVGVPGPGTSGDQDPERTPKKRSDYEVIVERNIFAPPGTKPSKMKPTEKREEKKAEPPPLPWVITSIFFHEKGGEFRIVVEKDEKTPSLKSLKAGDELDGVKIVSIDLKIVVCETEGTKVEKKLGDPMPSRSPEAAPPEKKGEEEGSEERKAEPADPEVRDRLKDRYKKKPLPEPPSEK